MPPWSNPVRMPPRHGGGPRSNRGRGVWVGGRRAMRPSAERDDAGASPARSMPRWLWEWSAPASYAGAMPVQVRPAAPGRVAQRIERLASNERDAGSTPAASVAPVVYRTGQVLAKDRKTVRFRPGALGAWCNRKHTGLRTPLVRVQLLARPFPRKVNVRGEVPRSEFCRRNSHIPLGLWVRLQ